MIKPHRVIFLFSLFLILLQFRFNTNINFNDKDKNGHTAIYIASLLHKAKKNYNGKIFAQMISKKLINELQSLNLGLTGKKEIAQVFSSIWKSLKKKVPSEFNNLNFREKNTFSFSFKTHLLVIDLDTLSPSNKNILLKRQLFFLSQDTLLDLTGYSIIRENNSWKFNGFYNLKKGYLSFLDKKDEIELIKKSLFLPTTY